MAIKPNLGEHQNYTIIVYMTPQIHPIFIDDSTDSRNTGID